MPELLRLKTKDWELTLWSSDITSRQNILKRTLARHNKTSSPSKIIFSKQINAEVFQNTENYWLSLSNIRDITIAQPLFFENTQYQFEWVFFDPSVNNAFIAHKLTNLNNSFRFSAPRNEHDLPRLIGGLNTGNDIGWLKLPLHYTNQFGRENSLAISLEVLPTKMDMTSDLVNMYKKIDIKYPLWRFNLASKTEQSISAGNNIGYFPILWLAHFENLRQKLLLGLKVVTNTPHSNLKNKSRYVKAEKLKGKLSNKQVELFRENIKQGFFNENYRHSKKYLSLDTPENRFIKKVVSTTKSRLTTFHEKLVKSNAAPDNQQLSSLFINEIKGWQEAFTRIESQTFLKEIPNNADSEVATIVLQQKTGYNTVYKIWQELKFYLDMFDSQSSVSMKSVSEIYELWCLLEIREIILNTLHFKEVEKNTRYLSLKDLEYRMKDGFGGAFEFERSDGIKIRLVHEPVFSKKTSPIRTYWATQKPDLLMEVTLPNHSKYIWIFDAKYRIESNNNRYDPPKEEIDFVPEDAINQMHRYRDALINCSQDESGHEKSTLSRPVYGAFALYPGFFNQISSSNPYQNTIEKVGIGAFALLPNSEFSGGNQWLKNYLVSQIGLSHNSVNNNFTNEALALKSPSRIPLSGMYQNLYKNLTLVSILGATSVQNEHQFLIKDNGNFSEYRVSKKLFGHVVDEHILREIKFVAISETKTTDQSNNFIDAIWPIKSVELGYADPRESKNTSKCELAEPYWIISLGQKLKLNNAIENIAHYKKSDQVKLTTLELLDGVKDYDCIPEVYVGRVSIPPY
ncbi:DUF2357 domain-containing protein [Polynucleobacter sp. Adler-ghost]|uniref:DUF2357 domain-containing protein n=1 Tax=Polynucleobacter sp. Adler-ghost TaxID=2770234 RepID=UPI001BFD01A4|nr:DUF2357 domain-containing protein [Polynucleobacter sp. Adler-ghost]QWE29901.1 DUF2357 domain-containing protein [Polynucleobacter sp. Adler-ghost]